MSLTLRATVDTSVSPSEVIAGVTDFSPRRAEIWPNVRAGHFEVHDQGETWAEATEELWPTGIYERCRYDWSDPGHVMATILDSNALRPGSTWNLTATGTEGGTHVEAVFVRDYKAGFRGVFAHVVNRLAGNRLAASDLRRALASIERLPR